MKKNYTRIVLVFILWLVVNASLAQSQFRFQHFGRAEGMPHEYVWRMAQDSLGFIWVNYMDRLGRFDGHSFKTYKYDPNDSLSPPLDFVLGRVFKDSDNNFWFTEHKPELGSKKTILLKYDRQSDSFIKYQFFDVKIKNGWVASLSFEKDGASAWVGTFDNALYNYNFKSGVVSNYLNIGPDGKAQGPYFIFNQMDLGPSILLSTDIGLWIFDKDSKKFSRPPIHPADTTLLFSFILTKAKDNVNNTWLFFSPSRTLIKINSQFKVLQRINLPESLPLGNGDVDKDGVFWFGGVNNSNNGLHRFDTRDGSLVNMTHDPANPQSLSTNYILDVMIDADDNVWVATDRDLNFLGRKDINFYNKVIDEIVCANMVYKSKNEEFLILSKHLGVNNNQLFISPIIPERPDSINLRPFLEPMEGLEIQSIHKGILIQRMETNSHHHRCTARTP